MVQSETRAAGDKPAQRVYERVKMMLSACRIRPGERINEAELAKELGVSRTPLREALGRLISEGLVTSTLNRGYSARTLDAHRVLTLYEYRAVVEAGAVRLACERASTEALDELEAFARASRDEPDDRQAVRLLRLDEEFHERIATLSGNAEFLRSVQSLDDRIRFVRWIDMQNGRRARTQAEHLEIVHLLKAREAQAAGEMMQRHISRRLDQIVEVIKAGYAEIYTGNALAADAMTKVA